MNIKRLYLSGFKSIDELELTNTSPFSVFAGANGAGKSNICDALCFVSKIIKIGAVDAIRHFGGYEQIHCYKKKGARASSFKFAIEIELEGSLYVYELELKKMKSDPTISEKYPMAFMTRKDGGKPLFKIDKKQLEGLDIPKDRSVMMFAFDTPIYQWLTNINVYRIDPYSAKEPDSHNSDNSELAATGNNLATMLAALEKNDDFREIITEWMEMIVPGMEKFSTESQRFDDRQTLTFHEEGTKKKFPANLISDGTIYVLSILTAILTRSTTPGFTLIEEPERGINPKAIAQIVELMREYSTNEHPIWVTTHNETLVRSSRPKELLLVNKMKGKTLIHYGRDAANTVKDMDLDKAWMSNLFGGGLPW